MDNTNSQQQNAKYAKYGYTHFLHYTIEHNCHDWVTAINGKARRGKLPYRVIEFKIETA